MKKLLTAIVILGICTAPAFAKVKHVVKAKPVQCAVMQTGFVGCTPLQTVFWPVVVAGDISMGIINGVTGPFR